jgi:hypothetical protein
MDLPHAVDFGLSRDLGAAGPARIDDVFEIGAAMKQIVGFIERERRLQGVDEAVKRWTADLDVE